MDPLTYGDRCVSDEPVPCPRHTDPKLELVFVVATQHERINGIRFRRTVLLGDNSRIVREAIDVDPCGEGHVIHVQDGGIRNDQIVIDAIVFECTTTVVAPGRVPHRVTIGRGGQCDFRLDHPNVFERHAQIYYHQEHYWIKDLTGKNLICINGTSVAEQGMLALNDRLSLSAQGPDFRFLGGGRLAEIEPELREDAPSSPIENGEKTKPGIPKEKGVKQLGAIMKKMLKR